MIRFINRFAVIGFMLSSFVAKSESLSVGIMGDSLSTGAGTHPSLEFDADSMWDVFKGVRNNTAVKDNTVEEFLGTSPLSKPNYLKYSKREFKGSIDWVFANLQQKLSEKFLNTEEYSWGYLVSKSEKIQSENIYIAAENGARVGALSRQTDRLLDHLDGKLSSKIYVFFTGNDLCAANLNFITSAADFKKELVTGLKYMVINGKAHSNGTKIDVIGFLPLTQILIKESILDKKVKAFGENLSCRELRDKHYQANSSPKESAHPEAMYMGHLIPPNPAKYCPTLFALKLLAQSESGLLSSSSSTTEKDSDSKNDKSSNDLIRDAKINAKVDEMFSILASRIRQYRAVSKEAVEEVSLWAKNTYPNKAIELGYIQETETINIENEDVGNDCFHLSLKGQAKVARAVLSHPETKEAFVK